MAELIAIPLKKPSDVDVIKPLTNVIKSTYNNPGNQKDYTDAIAEFSKLRNNALWRAFEKYESSLQVIYRYESSLSVISFDRATITDVIDCHNLPRRSGLLDFADHISPVLKNFTISRINYHLINQCLMVLIVIFLAQESLTRLCFCFKRT